MQSQKSNEKKTRIKTEREIEIGNDYSKARQFPQSIIGRKRLRELRKILWEFGVRVHIPMNSAFVTDEYCRSYSKEEEPSDLL